MGRSKKNWDHLVTLDGNYGIDIANGIWPGSSITSKGDPGPKGDQGQKGNRGLVGPQGKKGDPGPKGDEGNQGPKGDSAYTVAVNDGFIGDETQWLTSLKGEKGEQGPVGEKGGFTDLTEDEKDFLKGDQGEQGEKGEPAGVFEFKGKEDSLSDIEALPGPHEPGDVYQDASTDDLYVWDGTGFVLLSEALEVVKGQKGEAGVDGTNGLDGDKGERGFRGQKGLEGVQGEIGPDGKSAFDVAVEEGFPGTQTEWVESLKGETGDEGEKGEQGSSAYDLSQKGLPVDEVIDEDAWLESLKGEKGDNYDPLVLDDYYDKGQVEERLAQMPEPWTSYDINYMPDESEVASGETANFLDNDPEHVLYNPGLVAVQPGAIISNSPVTVPFVIRNTTLKDDSTLRGADYTILQEVIQLSSGSVKSAIRTSQPASNTFSPWSESTFAAENYYNKTETNDLIDAISYTLGHDSSTITLTDKDGTTQSVLLAGDNGISVTSGASGIVIDGSALTPNPQFLGLLQAGQDPDTEEAGRKQDGSYFIYAYTGTTVNTDPDAQNCTPGDWCIYNVDKWEFLDISSDPGVVSLDVSGGLLSIDNTDPANPIVELDSNDVVTPDELEDYLEKETFVHAITSRRISDLADVEINYTRTNFSSSSSRSVFSLSAGDGKVPSQDGERATDIENNALRLAINSSSGITLNEFYNNLDVGADPPQMVRITGSGLGIGEGSARIDTIVSKQNVGGSYLEIVFTTPTIPIYSSGFDGEVILDIVTGEASTGDILVYDSTDHTWKAGEAGDYVKKSGDTMSGKLTIDSRDSVADEETMFAVRGEQPGGADGNILKAIRKATEGDQIRYYGPQTASNELITKGYVSGAFLPLTGGELKAETNTLTLSVAASDTLTDDGNVLLAKDKDGSNILRLQNNGDLTLSDKLFVGEEVNIGSAKIQGNNLGDFWVTYANELQVNDGSGNIPIYAYNGDVKVGGPQANLDPSMVVEASKIRLYKSLHGFNGGGTDGQVLVSNGAVAAPEWKGVGEALAEEGHNFIVKPYTVYTAEYVTELTPEAPDGNFHDGELYFSTLTTELFVYGGGNWWPTAVDFQTDIRRIDNDLSYKLSKDRDNVVPSGFNVKNESGENLLKWNGSELSVKNVAAPQEDGDATTKEYVDTLFNNTAEMPIGSIVFWGGTIAKIPSGWLECRGQAAPANVQSLTGRTHLPNLRDYMPAGVGGPFGTTLGNYASSKIKSHSHTVQRLEPGNTTGDPDDASGHTTSRYRYWRGNDSSNGHAGDQVTKTSSSTGDNITAPPVYLGVYIMKVS